MNNIKSCNSISGGKTSCYMAIHYPADLNIFACVLTNDPACQIRDKGLLREIQNKLPRFEGSRELDQTLINLLRLEQEIGKEIKWVAAESTYDELIAKRKYLPNKFNRFCTVELKILPICYYLYLNYGMVIQQVGFRADEQRRVNTMMSQCDKAYTTRIPVGCTLGKSHRQIYKEVEWRLPTFPLAENGIDHTTIIRYWDKKQWEFPSISNCDFCFFHKHSELSEQREKYPDRFKWWESTEIRYRFSFGDQFLSQRTEVYQPSLFEVDFACACTD